MLCSSCLLGEEKNEAAQKIEKSRAKSTGSMIVVILMLGVMAEMKHDIVTTAKAIVRAEVVSGTKNRSALEGTRGLDLVMTERKTKKSGN